MQIPLEKQADRRFQVAGGTAAVGLGVVLLVAVVALITVKATSTPQATRDAHLAAWQGTVPVLDLQISQKHWQSLERNRELQQRLAQRLHFPPVHAQLADSSKHLGVVLNLSGPLDTERPSNLGALRVEVKDGGDWKGLRAFVLRDPEEPGLLREAVFYEALRSVGLLYPQIRAVWLERNGQAVGPAVAVQIPDAASIRAELQVEGVLLAIDPTVAQGVDLSTRAWLAANDVTPTAESDPGQTHESREFARDVSRALQAVIRGETSVDSVLDASKSLQWWTVALLLHQAEPGAWASARWVASTNSQKLQPFARHGLDAPLAVDAMLGRLVVERSDAIVAAQISVLARLNARELQEIQRRLLSTWPNLDQRALTAIVAELKQRLASLRALRGL